MENKVVQCHGANRGAECAKCLEPRDGDQLKKAIKDQKVMYCNRVVKDEKGEENYCGGPVKPCITFFGQGLPDKFGTACDKIRNVSLDNKYKKIDVGDEM